MVKVHNWGLKKESIKSKKEICDLIYSFGLYKNWVINVISYIMWSNIWLQ